MSELEFGAEAPALEFGETEAANQAASPVVEAASATVDDSILTEEEKAQVAEFVEKIDIHNTAAITQYGAATQRKMADFSTKTLENVRTKDMGQVGDMVTDLVTELKGFEIEEEETGITKFFKKKANKVVGLKARYDDAEKNVEKIVNELEKHQVTLMKDIDMLDKMYELNLQYFKEVSMYILAGKEKLEIVKSKDLAELRTKAAASGTAEDAQAVKDLENQIDRFEKKIHDLELTRMIAIQTAPQIRLVQSSDTVMVDKIQSTLVNTIPLWKNQMVIALGVDHANKAAQAQREVTDMTNELLKKNSQALKQATIETAKEAERGIVDIETLQKTNADLIATLDEVVRIQEDGRAKRAAAEVELGKMEDELKDKLLHMREQ